MRESGKNKKEGKGRGRRSDEWSNAYFMSSLAANKPDQAKREFAGKERDELGQKNENELMLRIQLPVGERVEEKDGEKVKDNSNNSESFHRHAPSKF